MAGDSSVDAVQAELALLGARFVLPGVGADVDQAIGVAYDLLVAGLGTPATVEVAGFTYGTPLRDAGPVIREMLGEQGFGSHQLAGPLWDHGNVVVLREAMGEEAFADWLTNMERTVLR